jgi:hypothetical protein
VPFLCRVKDQTQLEEGKCGPNSTSLVAIVQKQRLQGSRTTGTCTVLEYSYLYVLQHSSTVMYEYSNTRVQYFVVRAESLLYSSTPDCNWYSPGQNDRILLLRVLDYEYFTRVLLVQVVRSTVQYSYSSTTASTRVLLLLVQVVIEYVVQYSRTLQSTPSKVYGGVTSNFHKL